MPLKDFSLIHLFELGSLWILRHQIASHVWHCLVWHVEFKNSGMIGLIQFSY